MWCAQLLHKYDSTLWGAETKLWLKYGRSTY
jgi:hypothetical protein